MKNKRALSVQDIRSYKPNILDFKGYWLNSIGCPELCGSWIIWGSSANGKTRFALQLAKYFASFHSVAYNSLEEGLSLSMKDAIMDVGMSDVNNSFVLLDKEPINLLVNRLRKRRSPRIVFVDSLQYTGMTYAEYIRITDEFRDKLFVFISHADGKEPKGNVAKSIRYDAFVKIYVEGYKAFPQSRYGGGDEFVIWGLGADRYWGYK